MVRQRGDSRTGDLLGWEPRPCEVERFPAPQIRAATIGSRIVKAMSVALKECGKTRDKVAADMSDYLGETVSKQMLDAYVSEARTTHSISFARFAALVHATGDNRLLTILPELFGFAVVEERLLPAIEDAMLIDKIERLSKQQKMARKRWSGGA